MIEKYEDFGSLVMNYAQLFSSLTECQDGMSPKVFNKFADSVFKDFHYSMKLYYAENNYKQAIREEKRNAYLKVKEWKNSLKKKKTVIKQSS